MEVEEGGVGGMGMKAFVHLVIKEGVRQIRIMQRDMDGGCGWGYG